MVRKPFPRGIYADALPSGEFAVLILDEHGNGSHIETHFGEIKLPEEENKPGEKLLFLRITNVGGFKIAAKSQSPGDVRLWKQSHQQWSTLPKISHGTQGHIFAPDGSLFIIEPAPHQESQGIRYWGPNGPVFGTPTSKPTTTVPRLFEWTDLGDGIFIGQGDAGGVVIFFEGKHFLLEPGNTLFIQAHRAGNQISVALFKPAEEAVLLWFTVDEIRTLPPYTQAQPEPGDPPPPPPPPMLIAPNEKDTVARVIAAHPEIDTTNEETRGRVLDYVCKDLNPPGGDRPWGRKARRADGSNKNTDGLTFLRPDGLFEIYDVIGGGSGEAMWKGFGPFRQGENGFWAPAEPVDDAPEPTDPELPPICECADRIAELERALETQDKILTAIILRLERLETTEFILVGDESAEKVGVSRGLFGHSHDLRARIARK